VGDEKLRSILAKKKDCRGGAVHSKDTKKNEAGNKDPPAYWFPTAVAGKKPNFSETASGKNPGSEDEGKGLP